MQIFNKKKDFSSIIQAQNIGINLTETKTPIEKRMMLGLNKEKKTRRQIEAIIRKAEVEVKLEITRTDKIKAKALKGLQLHREITKRKAQ